MGDLEDLDELDAELGLAAQPQPAPQRQIIPRRLRGRIQQARQLQNSAPASDLGPLAAAGNDVDSADNMAQTSEVGHDQDRVQAPDPPKRGFSLFGSKNRDDGEGEDAEQAPDPLKRGFSLFGSKNRDDGGGEDAEQAPDPPKRGWSLFGSRKRSDVVQAFAPPDEPSDPGPPGSSDSSEGPSTTSPSLSPRSDSSDSADSADSRPGRAAAGAGPGVSGAPRSGPGAEEEAASVGAAPPRAPGERVRRAGGGARKVRARQAAPEQRMLRVVLRAAGAGAGLARRARARARVSPEAGWAAPPPLLPADMAARARRRWAQTLAGGPRAWAAAAAPPAIAIVDWAAEQVRARRRSCRPPAPRGARADPASER